jgi:cytochrome c-type biogenesis protein CcmF
VDGRKAIWSHSARCIRAAVNRIGRVDIRHAWNEDLYVNFAGIADEGTARIEVFIFPLVSWLWIGAGVLAAGTLVAFVPS